MPKPSILLSLVAFAAFTACAEVEEAVDDHDDAVSEVDEATASDAVPTASTAAGACYCAGAAACGYSKSPRYMYSGARHALARAGVPESALTQTYGDYPASLGTHCPEPGKTYSAATDIEEGSAPCARTHALRMQGFAAWYRKPPQYATHIHAIYAGAPGLKSSLRWQVARFLEGRDGLTSNRIERTCPITAAEKAAVRSAQ